MSVELLDKMRRINRLLHYDSGNVVSFGDICRVMSLELGASVVVLSSKGKILGLSQAEPKENDSLWPGLKLGSFIDASLNERLLNILSTQDNASLEALGFPREAALRYRAIISPVEISRVRLGSIFIYREGESFDVDEIILTEHGTMIIGLEMRRSLNEESAAELRKKQVVQSAIGTLSASELDAVRYILEELDGKEGILVASKVADRVGITRSVIVNALRKLESAEVIESRSSGMKGTYIRIINDLILEELKETEE
ncbi:MAG: GTP-sensing pleiotropic transcriptional regulator CodY [Lachnospiraceae bacterium]|nr:GTP-sensing pleiotropic transcriptional regulator CodY [Lachnospiraceae bacterium]